MLIRQKLLKHGYTDSVTDIIFFIVWKMNFLLPPKLNFGVMEAFDSKGIINTLEKYCQPWNMLTLQLSLSLRDR